MHDTTTLREQGSIKGSGWNKKAVTDEDERTIRLDIAEIIMHPLFTEEYDFDVALLRLAHPVDLASIEATPICLPKVGLFYYKIKGISSEYEFFVLLINIFDYFFYDFHMILIRMQFYSNDY